MSWTYKFSRILPRVLFDTLPRERAIIKKYLYYLPDEYNVWKKGDIPSSFSHSALLIGDENIPHIGESLSGDNPKLSAFYFNRVLSIDDLNSLQNPQAASYAVVTLLYLNMPQTNNVSYSPQIYVLNKVLPWDAKCDDFTMSWSSYTEPFTFGHELSGSTILPSNHVVNTAGDRITGLDLPWYMMNISWSYTTTQPPSSVPYQTYDATINATPVQIGHIFIGRHRGLLLPTTVKPMYKTDTAGNRTPYWVWHFTVLFKPYSHFYTEVYNVGKNFIDTSQNPPVKTPICYWQVYDPANPSAGLQTDYGNFNQMSASKRAVLQFNASVSDPLKRKTWNGGIALTPVPLLDTGEIDTGALRNAITTYTKTYLLYDVDTWNIAIRI